MVIALLRSAANDGTDALEKAKVAQVRTTADSFNARVESSIASLGGLGARPWKLTLRSAADQATLKTFAVDPDALSGTFLVDADDTVTNGVLLRPGMLGSKFDPPGWEKAKTELASSPAVVLPVAKLRRDDRAAELCLRRRHQGQDPTSVRGAFVFEQALTNDSPFSQEIRGLAGDGNSTATWRFLDSNGAVVASTLEQRAGITGARRTPALALRGVAPDRRQARRQRRRTRRRVARRLHPEPLGVRRAPGRAPAVGRAHPRPAAARRRPHPDRRPRPATAPVPGAGGPPARAQPLPGRVHLGRLPRAAHAGVRRARLPADEPRPLGGDERRGPAQRRTPRLHQRASPPGDDPRRARHREHRVGSLRLRPTPDGPRRRGPHGGGGVQQRPGRRRGPHACRTPR